LNAGGIEPRRTRRRRGGPRRGRRNSAS